MEAPHSARIYPGDGGSIFLAIIANHVPKLTLFPNPAPCSIGFNILSVTVLPTDCSIHFFTFSDQF
jgi:hypothetical protein